MPVRADRLAGIINISYKQLLILFISLLVAICGQSAALLKFLRVLLNSFFIFNYCKQKNDAVKGSVQVYIRNNMVNQSPEAKQLFLITGTVTGWLALILQFYLIIANRTASIPETIIRFFSFFTILTNILTALCFTYMLLKPVSGLGNFFTRAATLTAITVYITVVGLIYNVVLRFLWSPKGLQFPVDELLHSVIPVLFILYWLLFVPKQALKWKEIFRWMIYPALYCIFILIRGAIAGFYPYPFIDVNQLGYTKVVYNTGAMVLVFLVISSLFVGIAKIISREQNGKKLLNRQN